MNSEFKVIFFVFFLLPLSSGFSTLEQRHCCEIGKKWFEDNKGLCPTHPLYPHYFPPTNPFSPPQPINACLVSLEICCSDQQRKHSCRIAKKAAMVAKTCSLSLLRRKFRGLMISNGAGVDIKECCNCCRLGMQAAEKNSSCLTLHHSPLYSNQCKKTYRSCCLSQLNRTKHINQSDVQKTQGYDKHPTSNMNKRQYHNKYHGYGFLPDKTNIRRPSYTSENKKKYNSMYDYTSADDDTSEAECYHPCPPSFKCIRDKRYRPVCVRVSNYNGLNNTPAPPPSSSSSSLSSSASSPSLSPTSTIEDSSESIDSSIDKDFQIATKNDVNDDESDEKEEENGHEYGKKGCEEGFVLDKETQECIDRDECAEGLCRQDHMSCTNTWGSYSCVCQEGFVFNPRIQLCQDNDECAADKHNCLPSERCVNNYGGYECLSIDGSCRRGFQLIGGVCTDTDECQLGTHNCTREQRCMNSDGSFSCEPIICDEGLKIKDGECVEDATLSCETGFRRNKKFNICEDINECVERRDGRRKKRKLMKWMKNERAGDRIKRKRRMNEDRRGKLHNCTEEHMMCLNTLGSFECVCEDGFAYDSLSHSCQDVDECEAEEGDHSGEMESGSKTCPLNSLCVNTEGSYKCQCQPGFTNDALTQNCMDLDECFMGIHACEQVCVNTWGGYKCQCLSGFTTDPDDSNKCKNTTTEVEDTVGCVGCGEELCVGDESNQRCMVVVCPEYFVPVLPVNKDKRHIQKNPISIQSFESADEYKRLMGRRSKRNSGRYRMHNMESYRKEKDGTETAHDLRVNHLTKREKNPNYHFKKTERFSKRSGYLMEDQAVDTGTSQFHLKETPAKNEKMCVKEKCGPEKQECFTNQTRSIHWKAIQKPRNIIEFPHPLVDVHLKFALHYELMSGFQNFDVVRSRNNIGVVRLLSDIKNIDLEQFSLKVEEGSTNYIIHFILY